MQPFTSPPPPREVVVSAAIIFTLDYASVFPSLEIMQPRETILR
jgi:hypothetical protein